MQASIQVTAIEITLLVTDAIENQLLAAQVGKPLTMVPGPPTSGTYIVKAA